MVSGCWVGGEDRSIHFDRLAEGQGASMALPIYALYMQKVYKDKTLGYSEDETFEIPEITRTHVAKEGRKIALRLHRIQEEVSIRCLSDNNQTITVFKFP